MKVALITDTHFGARSDSQHFAAYFKRFYDEIFFPKLDELGIKRIIHLGDVVDRRKFINYVTSSNLRESLLIPAMNRGIRIDFIIGNHDATYKNTNKINSIVELYGWSDFDIGIYVEAEDVKIDGLNCLFVPWINSGNFKKTLDKIENTRAEVVFGHLELQGFQMYRGSYNDHGMETDVFAKFDQVFSGHFHHKSSNGNVHYLGAPYEITWSDFADDRGFHIYDTSTRELEFFKNPLSMFHKVYYDDTDWTDMTWIEDYDFSAYRDTYIKVVIKNKNNPFWFDIFIEKLEKSGVADFQVVDDNLNLNFEDDEDIIDEAEDTMTILKKYIDGMNFNGSKKDLTKLFESLYNEVLQS